MTKGECSTRHRTPEKNENPTSLTAIDQDPNNRQDTRERRLGKEKPTLGDGERIPSKLSTSYAEVAQATVPAVNDTRVIASPPSAQTTTDRVIQVPLHEPDGELNTPPSKTFVPRDLPPPPPESGSPQEQGRDTTTFLPDDINFPRLQTPMSQSPSPRTGRREGHNSPAPQLQTPPTKEQSPTPAFVWGPKPVQEEELRSEEAQSDKGKVKLKHYTPKVLDSGPITRQGYRT